MHPKDSFPPFHACSTYLSYATVKILKATGHGNEAWVSKDLSTARPLIATAKATSAIFASSSEVRSVLIITSALDPAFCQFKLEAEHILHNGKRRTSTAHAWVGQTKR